MDEDEPPRFGRNIHLDEDRGFRPKKGGNPLVWFLSLLLAAGLGALGMRYWSRQEASKTQGDASDLRLKLQQAEEKLSAAEKEKSEKASAAADLEQKLAAHSTKDDESEKVIADLRSKLDSKVGEVSRDSNRITVSLVDEILFKSGDASLSPRGKQVLSRVGEVLKGLTSKQILIGGHTDKIPIHTPQFPSNWELSSARAINVVHYLSEEVGVDPHRLAAAGYSEFHPRSRRSKGRNRRIEILLTPNTVEKEVGIAGAKKEIAVESGAPAAVVAKGAPKKEGRVSTKGGGRKR
jgi:chemotaxis protein MotB